MLCSVIIPTRNRSKFLEGALNSLCEQTLPQDQFELLIVDNTSKDNTKEVAYSFLPKFKNARYIYTEEPGLHVGRHKGLFEAQTDILVYADDDIIAFPTWLEGITESFQDPAVALVGGNNYPSFQATSPWWLEKMWKPNSLMQKCIPYISVLDFGQQITEIDPSYIFGCNFSIRKSILLQAGGFHPDGMPENLVHLRGDGELHVSNFIKQKGYKSLFNFKASIYHVVPENRLSLDYFKRSAFRHGVSASYSQVRSKGGIDAERKNMWYSLKYRLQQLREIIAAGKEAYVSCLPIMQSLKYSRLVQEIHSYYCKGYDYHQKMVKEDQSLLEWVLKPYYY